MIRTTLPLVEVEQRLLPRAAAALERADRMLPDLIRHSLDPVAFRDRLPYVLDLLAAVSRLIDEESKGQRTNAFSEWWRREPIPRRADLFALRHAELKALKEHAAAHWDTVINAAAKDYPGGGVADGDTVSRVVWVWADGPFVDEQVAPVLQSYFVALKGSLERAEHLLGSG